MWKQDYIIVDLFTKCLKACLSEVKVPLELRENGRTPFWLKLERGLSEVR